MDDNYAVARFDGAIRLLPRELRGEIRMLTFSRRRSTEEIRLRLGKQPTVVINGKEEVFSEICVTKEHIAAVTEIIAGSGHTVAEAISNGYITATGGYRVGICGDAAVSDGKIIGFHTITSVNIRISRDICGIASEIVPRLAEDNSIMSTLIISPPGGGKTTFLRDTVRQLSKMGYRVAVADERGEVCAGFDVGDSVDYLSGVNKSKAVNMLMRSMSPQVIAVDEITEAEDIEAIKNAAFCGVSILATAHCKSADDLYRRPLYRLLAEEKIFQRAVVIKGLGHRTYELFDLTERKC